VQRPAGLVVEELHPAVIADQPVVVLRPLQRGLEGFHQAPKLLVTVRFNPFAYALLAGQAFLGGRASFGPGLTMPVRFPVELAPQKVEPPVQLSHY
jgi:hypothetical protein